MRPYKKLADHHPEVAEEWDWEADGSRTPQPMKACSNTKAAQILSTKDGATQHIPKYQ